VASTPAATSAAGLTATSTLAAALAALVSSAAGLLGLAAMCFFVLAQFFHRVEYFAALSAPVLLLSFLLHLFTPFEVRLITLPAIDGRVQARLTKCMSNVTRNTTRNTKNRILAMSAATKAIPPNPSRAATMAMIRNINAQRSIDRTFRKTATDHCAVSLVLLASIGPRRLT
jgi:hypothetical protein